jgi:pyochelin biosynthetic protein PchC
VNPANRLAEPRGSARELWLREYHDGHGPLLVCFPHAGGSASYFHPLSASLAESARVLAVQYPGRQDRRGEQVVEDIGKLADMIFEVVEPACERPLAFFGHSMGAVLAYEIARRLERDHARTPDVLMVSGRRAPSIYRTERVHLHDDDGLVTAITGLGGTEPGLLHNREIREITLPAVRGDYRAIEGYRHSPGPKLTCPITALTGDADPLTTIREASAWSEHTHGEFNLRIFPGGHFYLAEHRRLVTSAISAEIEKHCDD